MQWKPGHPIHPSVCSVPITPKTLLHSHQTAKWFQVPYALTPRNDRMRIVVNKRQIRYIFLLLKNIDFLVQHSGGIKAKRRDLKKIGRTTSNTHQIMGMWKCATENGNDEASHFWVCVDKLFCSIYGGGGRHLTPLILGPLVQVSHQVMRLCIKLFFCLFLTKRVKPLELLDFVVLEYYLVCLKVQSRIVLTCTWILRLTFFKSTYSSLLFIRRDAFQVEP